MERGWKRYSYIAYPVSVRVTALTHIPGILIPGTLQPGRPSNLTCSVPWACERGTPPIFSWAGASVSHLDPVVTSSPVLTLTPRPQDHGTALSCQVTLPAASVTTRTTVQLNISLPTLRGPALFTQGELEKEKGTRACSEDAHCHGLALSSCGPLPIRQSVNSLWTVINLSPRETMPPSRRTQTCYPLLPPRCQQEAAAKNRPPPLIRNNIKSLE
ncbi:Sialic acid-binding Ig-like lectin 9 [Heterocephalus glaber]|nr:Sialic acid-binding Ig-like lectin 9 [Heterocephalus glaber]